jgi:hypothetical protein
MDWVWLKNESLDLAGRGRGLIMAMLLACSPVSFAMAQSALDRRSGTADQQYVPRLGDIMDAAQARHAKLWFAGKARNWDLAAYELRQLKASLVEAALLYSGIPVSNVTTLQQPLQSVSDAIDAKDDQRFSKSFADLTEGCNSCHRSMGRSFILLRIPTDGPFGNQVFPPSGKK